MPRAPLPSVVVCVVAASVLVACSGPSKSQAMDDIRAGVTEDNTCTLPLEVLSQLKVQHATKAVCVPKEGADKALTCINALVKAGVTKPMPASYMVAWPDDVNATSFKDLSAYDRRARNLVYSTCVELGLLRDGRFACAEAKAKEIVRIGVLDDKTADVRYLRDVALSPTLPAVEAACGSVLKPPAEATVQLTKADGKTWTLAPKPPPE